MSFDNADEIFSKLALFLMVMSSKYSLLISAFIRIPIVNLTLFGFLCQQIYLTSIGMTQVEAEKLDLERQRRKHKGILNKL
jgi:hypothetical protein